MFKTLVVGTRWNRLNRLAEAVLLSIHNLCFWTEIKKKNYTPKTPVLF